MEQQQKTVEKLNELLCTYSVFYQNTRGFHWNVKGPQFFELHIKFEELYNSLQTSIDEIAERILTLGETPHHTLSDFLKHSKIAEACGLTEGSRIVEVISNSLTKLISMQQELLEITDETGDEGTNSLMSDYIRDQEKLLWMYSAYLGRKPHIQNLRKSA